MLWDDGSVDVENKISWQKKMEGERRMMFQEMLEEFHHYKTNLAQLVLSVDNCLHETSTSLPPANRAVLGHG